METVEGAAAGLYVAALMESGRPDHRGLDTARLVSDARAAGRSPAARGRLAAARRFVRRAVSVNITLYPRADCTGNHRRAPRPRAGAAARLVAVGGSEPRREGDAA